MNTVAHRRAILAACALLAAPGLVRAQQDASVVDGGGEDAGAFDAELGLDQLRGDADPGCGAITYQGQCQGDRLRYCVGGSLREVDCSSPASFPGGGPGVTCGLADCDDVGCQGSWCVAELGAPCGALGCDVAQGQGCLGGVCAPSSVCDPARFTPRCEGERYIFCSSTISDLDCSAGGQQPYTCVLGEAGDEPCVGLPGAACMPLVGKKCAAGLVCLGQRCVVAEDGGWVEDAGHDAGIAATDASSFGLDAGGKDAPEDGACRCAGSPTRASGPLLTLLPGWLWRRRRGL